MKMHATGDYFFFQSNTTSVMSKGMVQLNQITVGPRSENFSISAAAMEESLIHRKVTNAKVTTRMLSQ